MFTVQRLEAVQSRVAAACAQVGRRPEEITLVGVTKTVSFSDIINAQKCGLSVLGENRVQEATAKIIALRQMGIPLQWHLIGHLQTNKAGRAVELFDLIQSVDSLKLGEHLQKHAAANNRVLEIFIEVNTSGEASKFGVAPSETITLAREFAAFPNLRLTGLMTIGALTEDQEKIRRCFRMLRELAANVSAHNLPEVTMRHLSMGMTDDFEIAIAEGATMVRIGRAIFGERLN